MQDLTVTFVQTNLFWEEPQKNLEHFEWLLKGIKAPGDLILLPEMFNTGFSINPGFCAEQMDGPSMRFLAAKSREKNAVIMATLLISEHDRFFNRLICMYPDGHFGFYDKRHLFRLSEEYKIISGGNKKMTVSVKGWNIATIICYDLRFPVWSKNTYTDGTYEYDLLVCLANWPGSRSDIWKTLLTARAIENQAYVAGVNRVGEDGHGTFHSGDSLVCDPKGQQLIETRPGHEEIRTITLSSGDLALYREAFTVGLDWDPFTIQSKTDNG
jgi:predicted amidohydrolase